MAVVIRCRRMGANKAPSFRVVAADSRSARDGKCIETLGWYDPKRTGINFELNMERVAHWQKHGARLSDTVQSLVDKSKTAVTAEPDSAES